VGSTPARPTKLIDKKALAAMQVLFFMSKNWLPTGYALLLFSTSFIRLFDMYLAEHKFLLDAVVSTVRSMP
jgi:hypothetical protein